MNHVLTGRTQLGFAHTASHLIFGAVLLGLGLLLEGPEAMAQAWLLCFAIASGVPVGSLVLLMIHRLTGGAWGFALAPVLRGAALCIPIVALAFIPLALTAHLIYPWSGAGDPVLATRLYLNIPAFLARTAVALIGWSVLGIIFARGTGGRLLAALGLAFYGLTISVVAIDWFLSVDPHYTSTAFGAMIAIEQMLTALAAAALLAPQSLSKHGLSDLASFLIAALLGVVYLALTTFIVDWYGNLPDKAHWYLLRQHRGWHVVIDCCAFLALLSFAALLLPRVRDSHRLTRLAGVAILIGIALHMSWLVVPAFASHARLIAAALFCFPAMMLIAAPLVAWLTLRPEEAERHAG